MSIKSLSHSSLLDNQWYKSMLAGNQEYIPGFTADFLVIAGGGGGGANGNQQPGGGGAGGYRSSFESSGGGAGPETVLTLLRDTNYTVTVGGGGAGGIKTGALPSRGTNSVFATITSDGGGYGGTVFSGGWSGPTSGGSGGGGGPSGAAIGNGAAGIIGQGFDGGSASDNSGSGGGGAGEIGNTDGLGHGGDGASSSITGTAVVRAGGGATRSGTGGLGGGANPNVAGVANMGGGGGAGTNQANGMAGGSGLVIVRYPTTISANIGAGLTGDTINADNYKFTILKSGTGTISFSDTTAPAKPRYWRYVEGSAIVGHHPRVSRIDLMDGSGNATRLITYTSDNCSDSGSYQPGTVSIDLGAGNEKWFVNARIYSVFAGARSANFTLQYSYNNSTWTTAFGGIMANYIYPDTNTQACGLFFGYIG